MTQETKPKPDRSHRQNHTDRSRLQSVFLGIIAFAILLFLLVQAQFILISLAIAVILFSLTADAIGSISRLRIGRYRVASWLATVAAVLLISSALFAISAIVVTQVNAVLMTTLSFAEPAQRAVAEIFRWLGEDVEAAVLVSLRRVEISTYLGAVAGQAGSLLSASVLVTLFVTFLFAERVWFPTKLENLMRDPEEAAKVRRLMGTITRRVNYYLLVKAGISAVTGVLVYVTMLAFGLQFASAMGLLSFILNFLPSIGSIIATVLVVLVTYLQTEAVSTTLAIFVITGVMQFVNGNFIDPMLMGRTLRMSTFGIIISLAFWGAIWGVAGMFLAVPITVAVMVVCAHVPILRPVAILLSREGLPDDD